MLIKEGTVERAAAQHSSVVVGGSQKKFCKSVVILSGRKKDRGGKRDRENRSAACAREKKGEWGVPIEG